MFRAIQRLIFTAKVFQTTAQPSQQHGEARAAPQDMLGAAVDAVAAAASGQQLTLVLPGQSTHASSASHRIDLRPAPHPVLTAQTLDAWAQAPGVSDLEYSDRREVARLILEAAQPMPGSFPADALVVYGDLTIRDFMALRTLPEGLNICGSLVMNNAPSLIALPGHLTVDAAIEAKGCPALTAIHDDVVAAKITLLDCKALIDVSATLKTAHLDLSGATSLVSLPATRWTQTLKLTGCTALQNLPESKTLRELTVTGCRNLAHLSKHLSLQRLDATGCTALRLLPPDLFAEDICLKGCTSLRELPEGFFVNRLDLTDCTGITRLDEPVAAEALNCSGCTNLVSLYASMHIKELNATGCTALKNLPAVLEVDRLTLVGCTALIKLPDAMLVRQHCDMRGCIGVQRLPRLMDIRGRLNTGGCTALTFAAAKAMVSSSPFMMKTLLAAQEDLGGANFADLIFSSEIDFFVGRVAFAERLGLLRAAQQMFSTKMDAEDFKNIVASLVHVKPEEHAAFIIMAAEIFAMSADNAAAASQLIRTLGELGTPDMRALFIEQLRDNAWSPDAVPEYCEIKAALSDVAAWHASLAETRTTRISQAQANDISCPISLATFAEMAYPVAFYTGEALRIFELEALLCWLETSIAAQHGATVGRNPTNNLALPLASLTRVVID